MPRFPPALTCFLLALLPTVLASQARRRQGASHQEYYLQTSVINATNDHGTDKEGLYVVGYHTGAGLNDVALTSNISVASKGFLNATVQQFDYNTPFPWYLDFGFEPYAGWAPVEINTAAATTRGFAINGTKLVGPQSLSFGGWLVCDWWHGVPQLFYLIAGYQPSLVIPASCSTVELQVISI